MNTSLAYIVLSTLQESCQWVANQTPLLIPLWLVVFVTVWLGMYKKWRGTWKAWVYPGGALLVLGVLVFVLYRDLTSVS